jgi:23S rRNA pseudouridine1911/1915/1917 synthase
MKQIRMETGICHFRIDREIELTDFIAAADLSPLAIEKQTVLWLDQGCVYVDGKRQRENMTLRPGQALRLHTKPKTYPHQFDRLSDHIVLDHDEFLVLDKPHGLPTHATLDNFKDNAKYILEQELRQPLFTTHRLDIPTRGLLIIAKSSRAQAAINKLFARGLVCKRYLAISANQVPPGRHDHFMDPEGRAPRVIRQEPRHGWWACSLEVEGIEPRDGFYQHKIRLFTGRTHQIRAQMSFLGAPLIGDSLYGSEVTLHDRIGLECRELGFRFLNQDFLVRRRD